MQRSIVCVRFPTVCDVPRLNIMFSLQNWEKCTYLIFMKMQLFIYTLWTCLNELISLSCFETYYITIVCSFDMFYRQFVSTFRQKPAFMAHFVMRMVCQRHNCVNWHIFLKMWHCMLHWKSRHLDFKHEVLMDAFLHQIQTASDEHISLVPWANFGRAKWLPERGSVGFELLFHTVCQNVFTQCIIPDFCSSFSSLCQKFYFSCWKTGMWYWTDSGAQKSFLAEQETEKNDCQWNSLTGALSGQRCAVQTSVWTVCVVCYVSCIVSLFF